MIDISIKEELEKLEHLKKIHFRLSISEMREKKIYDFSLNDELEKTENRLEKGNLDWAISNLSELKLIDSFKKEPDYYLVDYFLGQAIFRKEMNREKFRSSKINKAILYFEKSLEYNPSSVDTHLIIALALIVKAKYTKEKNIILEKAKQHFHFVVSNGNNTQVMAAEERLEFLDGEILRSFPDGTQIVLI